MKLCRFEIENHPEEPRSGIFHEGKVYETDGQNAIAIHDPANIRFLSPIGRPAALRCFESYEALPGEWGVSYFFLNPANLRGPNETFDLPPAVEELGIEVRVAAVLQDAGLNVEPAESDGFILGYTFVALFVDRAAEREGAPHPARWAELRDLGGFVAPFVVTPDELDDYRDQEARSRFTWKYKVSVNDEELPLGGTFGSDYGMDDLLILASRRAPVGAGEIIAWPALPLPELADTSLGRDLVPGDRFRVVVEGLGAITGQVG